MRKFDLELLMKNLSEVSKSDGKIKVEKICIVTTLHYSYNMKFRCPKIGTGAGIKQDFPSCDQAVIIVAKFRSQY
jgi:hypothetical protein